MGFTNWMRSHLRWLVVLGIVVFVGGGALWGYLSWRNSIENVGEEKQFNVSRLRTNVELEISTCLDSGAAAAQVAQQEYATIKDILVSTAAARYEGGDGALSQGGAMISMLVENNPQINQETWAKLAGVIVGCRKEIRDRQEELQGAITRLRTWCTTGDLPETWIRNNFPNSELKAVDALTGEKLEGMAALDYLGRVITTRDAKEAMKTGTMPDQQFFPTSSSAPPSR